MEHAFQPLPFDAIELNPFTKIGKEWGLLSAGSKVKFNTMTISWGGMGVLWNKNVAYVFVRDSRFTKELIDEGDFFSISFLGEEYRQALQFCGVNSGRDSVNKFAQAGLTVAFRHSIPYADEANFVVICKKMAAVPITKEMLLTSDLEDKFYKDGDYHTMYVGEIIDIMAR